MVEICHWRAHSGDRDGSPPAVRIPKAQRMGLLCPARFPGDHLIPMAAVERPGNCPSDHFCLDRIHDPGLYGFAGLAGLEGAPRLDSHRRHPPGSLGHAARGQPRESCLFVGKWLRHPRRLSDPGQRTQLGSILRTIAAWPKNAPSDAHDVLRHATRLVDQLDRLLQRIRLDADSAPHPRGLDRDCFPGHHLLRIGIYRLVRRPSGSAGCTGGCISLYRADRHNVRGRPDTERKNHPGLVAGRRDHPAGRVNCESTKNDRR